MQEQKLQKYISWHRVAASLRWNLCTHVLQPNRMSMRTICLLTFGLLLTLVIQAQENRGYKVFQFPADLIPGIDGNADDWALVPDDYTVGMDQLWDDSRKHDAANPENLEASVKIGWLKGTNRLYFLYEAYDDYWDS